MKTIVNKILTSICMILSVLLVMCGNPSDGNDALGEPVGGGGEVEFTLSLDGKARAMYPPDDAMKARMEITLTMTGAGTTLTFTGTGTTAIRGRAKPASYQGTVTAVLDGALYAKGSRTMNIKAGAENFFPFDLSDAQTPPPPPPPSAPLPPPQVTSWAELIAALGGTAPVIVINGSLTANSMAIISRSVTLITGTSAASIVRDSGYISSAPGMPSHIFQVNAGTLTLGQPGMDMQLAIDGGNPTGNSYGAIRLNGGNLVMNTNAVIENNIADNTYSATAVQMDGGNFTMNGGEIRNNTGHMGPAVHVYTGTFTMHDGSIHDNSMTSLAGSTSGSAVWVESAFVMDGGEIFNNTGENYGAVSLTSAAATFTMSGSYSAIMDNTTNTSGMGGGGVSIYLGTFTMNGGTISDNTAPHGGGVWLRGLTGVEFNLNSGMISGNDTSGSNGNGGGVFLGGGAIFNMSGGTISGNGVNSNQGGGVYAGGTFTMSNGTISFNGGLTTCGVGGGVFVADQFTMSGGNITGNFSSSSGGGVYINSTGTFTLDNPAGTGNITGNNDGYSMGIQVQDGGGLGTVNGTAGVTAGW